ncbi:ABC transporter permease [Ensifer adhaerens]|jgi:His/Glu/Gln/Arg/opine family amino acid ABC transporter permease subunit|uniref:ABC transporter permease n=1 Tax=Ensifer adhaerens TaxID=106592 RepID=UPI000FD94C19|nr:ABC transporter permease subunit [Ensifer adhaerens]MDF8356341.1 ABC transporter permease subunit [Ensifer adhaerens]THA60838.1 ABC transporter permease subunit [Ensifer adhaerens]
MDLLQGWGDEIAHGTLLTMKVAVLSLLVGLCWGMLGALAQMSPNRAVASLGRGFSLVMRGTPELLVILIVYFGGTVALTKAVNLFVADFGFVEVPPLQAGVFALSLVFGGYAAEVLRGAWQSVPSGVIEAGHSLGLGWFVMFAKIRLPLLMRFALPGLGNNWISLIKDTSLISIVGLHELMGLSQMATSVTRQPFTFYMTAALIYLTLTLANTRLIAWFEGRLMRGERRSPA